MKMEMIIKGVPIAGSSRPSLGALSFALRHPGTWPKGFRWDYNDCKKCAMGLACRLWSEIGEPNTSDMAREFAMTFEEAQGIFYGATDERFEIVVERGRTERWFGLVDQFEDRRVAKPLSRADITPEMVADDIDSYLARHAAMKA